MKWFRDSAEGQPRAAAKRTRSEKQHSRHTKAGARAKRAPAKKHLLHNRVRALLGERFMQAKPKMTAEDFSFYQLSAPGVFVFCGVGDEMHSSPLHAATFDFDEAALLPALALFSGLVTYTD